MSVDKNEHYIVINKPHDIRMDGDFNITIKKLLVNTFPGTTESSFKWVHQLDFATSGLLCVAKTREAASVACLTFELRETTKEYVALLEGHINTSHWPQRDKEYLGNIKASVEQIDPETEASPGEKRTVSSISQDSPSWQDQVMAQNLQLCLGKLSAYLAEHDSSASEELRTLSSIPFDNYCRNFKLRKRLRKGLKSVGIELDERAASVEPPTEKAPVTEEDVASSVLASGGDSRRPKTSSIETHLHELWTNSPSPFIFRYISEAQCSGQSSCTEESETPLVVAVPLVEPLEDFRMDIGLAPSASIRRVYTETWVHVLERGFYQDRPVTKVRLRLMTGRRHQLRVHCLCLGHPIIGDATYAPLAALLPRSVNPQLVPSQLNPGLAWRPTFSEATMSTPDDRCAERETDERMMLHAQVLRIPLPSSYEPSYHAHRYFKDLYEQKKNNPDVGPYLINVVTPDPFPLSNFT